MGERCQHQNAEIRYLRNDWADCRCLDCDLGWSGSRVVYQHRYRYCGTRTRHPPGWVLTAIARHSMTNPPAAESGEHPGDG